MTQNCLVPNGEVNEKYRFCKCPNKYNKIDSELTRKQLSLPRKMTF